MVFDFILLAVFDFCNLEGTVIVPVNTTSALLPNKVVSVMVIVCVPVLAIVVVPAFVELRFIIVPAVADPVPLVVTVNVYVLPNEAESNVSPVPAVNETAPEEVVPTNCFLNA